MRCGPLGDSNAALFWYWSRLAICFSISKSIEPFETQDFEKETAGLKAIDAKGKKFDSMVKKMHSIDVSEPLVVGNTIAFKMEMDATMNDGQRMKMPELCVYQVKDGKIILEEFFV